MNVRELLAACRRDRAHFQLHVNGFVDEFRGATAVARATMVAAAPTTTGPLEGLAAAVVSALCRGTGVEAPTWVARTRALSRSSSCRRETSRCAPSLGRRAN